MLLICSSLWISPIFRSNIPEFIGLHRFFTIWNKFFVMVFFILSTYYYPHRGQTPTSIAEETKVQKFLRHFSPTVVNTQMLVVIVFWTLLWEDKRKEDHGDGQLLFTDITDHTVHFAFILFDYFSCNIQHPKSTFKYYIIVVAFYGVVLNIYQFAADDIIYPTDFIDHRHYLTIVGDIFIALFGWILWKLVEIAKFKFLKIYGFSIERDERYKATNCLTSTITASESNN